MGFSPGILNAEPEAVSRGTNGWFPPRAGLSCHTPNRVHVGTLNQVKSLPGGPWRHGLRAGWRLKETSGVESESCQNVVAGFTKARRRTGCSGAYLLGSRVQHPLRDTVCLGSTLRGIRGGMT